MGFVRRVERTDRHLTRRGCARSATGSALNADGYCASRRTRPQRDLTASRRQPPRPVQHVRPERPPQQRIRLWAGSSVPQAAGLVAAF